MDTRTVIKLENKIPPNKLPPFGGRHFFDLTMYRGRQTIWQGIYDGDLGAVVCLNGIPFMKALFSEAQKYSGHPPGGGDRVT